MSHLIVQQKRYVEDEVYFDSGVLLDSSIENITLLEKNVVRFVQKYKIYLSNIYNMFWSFGLYLEVDVLSRIGDIWLMVRSSYVNHVKYLRRSIHSLHIENVHFKCQAQCLRIVCDPSTLFKFPRYTSTYIYHQQLNTQNCYLMMNNHTLKQWRKVWRI